MRQRLPSDHVSQNLSPAKTELTHHRIQLNYGTAHKGRPVLPREGLELLEDKAVTALLSFS